LTAYPLVYRRLQRHLNRMPVGFPRTFSRVELRVLARLFTPAEARLAVCMTHRLETAGVICRRSGPGPIAPEAGSAMLAAMADKGAVLNLRRGGEERYALVPLVVGMYEFQVQRLSEGLYRDTVTYFKQGFGLEYFSTAVPQLRVVPIRKSLSGGRHQVATYDEIRGLVRQAGDRLGLAPCICRKGKDLLGAPCGVTDRREVCLVMRDLFDHGHRRGWVQKLTTDAALGLLDRNEKEGLVLQSSNEQRPQFVCSCCGCCCGVLNMLQVLPRPAAFTASNYLARVDPRTCTGCGKCLRRCQMSAIRMAGKTAEIDSDRCIGCGVCVPSCKPAALTLVRKAVETRPPEDTDALTAMLAQNKPGAVGKLRTGVKIAVQTLQKKRRQP
jgi:electron transport complex protein RnfB